MIVFSCLVMIFRLTSRSTLFFHDKSLRVSFHKLRLFCHFVNCGGLPLVCEEAECCFGVCASCVPLKGEKALGRYTAACEQQVSQLTALLSVCNRTELCTSRSFVYTQTSAPGCWLLKHLLFLFTEINLFYNPSTGQNLKCLGRDGWKVMFFKKRGIFHSQGFEAVNGLQMWKGKKRFLTIQDFPSLIIL